MGTLNDFNYTDHMDDVLAVYVNRMLAATLRSEYKNVETLAADRELTDADTPIQRIDCDGVDRVVWMPEPDSVENHPFLIVNASDGGEAITVKSNDEAETHAVLLPGKFLLCLPNGSGGYGAIGTLFSTQIEGGRLIWNSGTSISVDVGSCHAENGDFIDITSTLTASSLSLSNSTWYHIYVYLNSGVPAMEVVTTAPAPWKGESYSKTGDTSRRYMGSVKTDSSGNIFKFLHDQKTNMISYKKFAANLAPHRCLTTGTATSATAVALSGAIPVTAEIANIRLTNTGDNVFRTSDDNGVSGSQNTVTLLTGSTVLQNAFVFHVTDSSQQIFYRFDGTVTTGGGFLDVIGYIFKR